jgi:hypothetical protein
MKLKNQIICLGLMTAILSSCGVKDEKEDSFFKPTLSENPIWLTSQEENCTSVFAFDDSKSIVFPQFLEGDIFTQFVDFKEQLLGNYVMSPETNKVIATTSYGVKTARTILVRGFNRYTGDYSSLNLGEKKKVSEGEFLEICPGQDTFKRKTYEAAGLSISNSITKTYNKVKSIFPDLELAPLDLSVAPEHKTLIKYKGGTDHRSQELRYETDNAYYSPTEKRIVFLPQSEEHIKDSISDVAYWELPMVASHEYGHHLFQTLFKDKIFGKISDFPPLPAHTNCFETNVDYNKSGSVLSSVSSATETRNNTASFATGSLNEGFADLVAFYSLDNKETSYKGVDCFAKNREVKSDSFMDGTSKDFGSKAQRLIKKEEADRPDSKCETPNFQEIHNIGAMFAHQADKLLSKTLSTKREKLKVILNWAKSLANEHSGLKEMNAIDYLYHSIELVHLEALKEKSHAAEGSCDVMDEVFTANKSSFTCKYLK